MAPIWPPTTCRITPYWTNQLEKVKKFPGQRWRILAGTARLGLHRKRTRFFRRSERSRRNVAATFEPPSTVMQYTRDRPQTYAARRARVLAAFFAAWLRARLPRLAAARFVWRAGAERPVVDRGSFFSAPSMARERVGEGLRFDRERRVSCAALLRVEALPRGGNLMPARRALDSPIAIACCGDRAPCFPSRTW